MQTTPLVLWIIILPGQMIWNTEFHNCFLFTALIQSAGWPILAVPDAIRQAPEGLNFANIEQKLFIKQNGEVWGHMHFKLLNEGKSGPTVTAAAKGNGKDKALLQEELEKALGNLVKAIVWHLILSPIPLLAPLGSAIAIILAGKIWMISAKKLEVLCWEKLGIWCWEEDCSKTNVRLLR